MMVSLVMQLAKELCVQCQVCTQRCAYSEQLTIGQSAGNFADFTAHVQAAVHMTTNNSP